MKKTKPDKSTEVVTTSPSKLLELAINKNLDIATLEKLMALQERWDAQQAKKAYYTSLSQFQMDCPPILKTKAGYDDRYRYAPLDQIIKVIKEDMFKNGLTYRWEQVDKDSKVLVTCVITHVSGHSEKTTLEAADDTSGSKNAIQAKGSTVQYLRRYTLESALGIATADEDIDGESKPSKAKPSKAKPPNTSKKPKKIRAVESHLLLTHAKISVDDYTDKMELKKNSGPFIQQSKLDGMHKKDVDELQKYINEKFVSLGDGNQDKIDLP